MIYKRFEQLDYNTIKNHQGHGLGITVSKMLLNILKGEVTFKSEKNAKTIFTILIPEWKYEISNETLFMQEEGLFFRRFGKVLIYYE